MIIFLILAFLIVILNILIIGMLLSRVSINIENCNVLSNTGLENIIVDKMQISINLYLYKVIKVLSIKFYKEYFKIGFIKIYYYKIMKYKEEVIIKTANLTKLLIGKNRLSLNVLKPNIEEFYMNLSLCSKNAALTSIASSLIGTTTSMILSKFVKKYDDDKIYYKIVPVYFNINGFKISIRTKINFNILNILEFLHDYYLVKNNK